MVGPERPKLDPSGLHLAPSGPWLSFGWTLVGPHDGPTWIPEGPSWAPVGPCLGTDLAPIWPRLGPGWAIGVFKAFHVAYYNY